MGILAIICFLPSRSGAMAVWGRPGGSGPAASDLPRQNGPAFSVGGNGYGSGRAIFFAQKAGLTVLKVGNDRTLFLVQTQHVLRAVGDAAAAADALVVIYVTDAHYIFSPSFLAAAMEACSSRLCSGRSG